MNNTEAARPPAFRRDSSTMSNVLLARGAGRNVPCQGLYARQERVISLAAFRRLSLRTTRTPNEDLVSQALQWARRQLRHVSPVDRADELLWSVGRSQNVDTSRDTKNRRTESCALSRQR